MSRPAGAAYKHSRSKSNYWAYFMYRWFASPIDITSHSLTAFPPFALVAIAWQVSKILSGQNKADFRLRDDELPPDLRPTATCLTVVRYLDAQREEVARCLDGRNLRSFLTELSARLLRLLVDHVKRFTITGAGGLVLMRDINEYRECVSRFGSPTAVLQHALLTDVAKIFLVNPENLRSLVEDSDLSSLDPTEFVDLVRARADFKSAWIGKYI